MSNRPRITVRRPSSSSSRWRGWLCTSPPAGGTACSATSSTTSPAPIIWTGVTSITPPLSIVMLAIVRGLLGDSLLVVRLVPALLFGLLVWLAACLARELGGGRFAQSLAALSVAIAPQYLALTGFYSMNAFDLVFWALAVLLLTRLVRTDDVRLWRPLGLVVGLGLLNKISLLFFAFGLGVAVLATPLRRHVKRRELWEGVCLALLLFTPYILWEMSHDWATLEFMRNATRYKNVALSPLAFATAQLTTLNPLNAPLWMLGLAWLLFGRTGRRLRALGIVFVATFVVLAVQNSKPYYLGPAFPVLLAAGALVVEGLSEAPRRRWVRPALLVLLVAGVALTAPFAIPVLPVETFIRYQRALGFTPSAGEKSRLGPLPQHFADRFGWHELTEEVARIYGGRYGLPPAHSPHNSYYFWGPGRERPSVLIVIGWSTEEIASSWTQVEGAGRIESPYAMPFETGLPIHVCRGLKVPLETAWRRA